MRFHSIAKTFAVGALVALAANVRAADDRVSMFGYFRVLEGSQVSPTKGNFTVYGLPGTHKFRLGNETDWAEFGTDILAFKGEDGSMAHAVFMLGYGYDVNAIGSGLSLVKLGTDSTGKTTLSNAPGFQQLYVELKKLPGVDAAFWLGKKYYKRQYSPINDFFYWSHQGFGAGMEDLNLGNMKVSYAILSATQSVSNTGYIHDLRLNDIRLAPGSLITVGVELAHPVSEKQTPPLETGYAANVQYVQDVLGGSNQLAVQYGAGPLGNSDQFGAGDPPNLQSSKDARKARVLDALSIRLSNDLGLDLVAVFQHDEQNGIGPSRNWGQFGGRLTYDFTDHAAFLLEAGYDMTKAPGNDALTLLKVTPALVLSGKRGGGAALKAFATFASWNDAGATAGVAGSGIGVADPSKKSALNIGLQGECGF